MSFNKDNVDLYLKEVSKQYRKINGKKMPAEIILIGGASILVNYGFRDNTNDMDAIINASSAMKEAINIVSDQYHLPNNWLNSDFMKTSSYSHKLREVSKYYRTFSNIVEVRTVNAEYLIAMKLCSGRVYKNDLSDIIGILNEHVKNGDSITYERIDSAMNILYGGWENVSEEMKNYIFELTNGELGYDEYYSSKRIEEIENKKILIHFQEDYPGVLKTSNLEDILKSLKEKQNKAG